MRPELKLYFDGLPDAGPATTTTPFEPHYTVNLVTLYRDPVMDDLDYLDCYDVRTYRHRFDAIRFAADLATTPIAVHEYAKKYRQGFVPEFVVVLDPDGKELDRKPILAIHPQKFIGVYRLVFVKDAPRSSPPFDVEDRPVRIYEEDEAETALDYAENAARVPQAGCRGFVVRDHRRQELGRFVSPEARRRGWRSMLAAALWRVLGWK